MMVAIFNDLRLGIRQDYERGRAGHSNRYHYKKAGFCPGYPKRRRDQR